MNHSEVRVLINKMETKEFMGLTLHFFMLIVAIMWYQLKKLGQSEKTSLNTRD